MQSSSRGPSVGSSPTVQVTTRVVQNDTHQASSHDNTASYAFPRSPSEQQKASDKAADTSQRNSVQEDDYHIFTSGSSSILSGCETVAPKSRECSTNRSARRGPHRLLTGLLSNHGGNGGEGTSRRSKSNGSRKEQQQQDTTSVAVPRMTMVKPTSRASHNPLLEGYEVPGGNASAVGTRIGAGGYDWPTPPSPVQRSENLHPPASSCRHELLGSPMLPLKSHPSHGGTPGRGERRNKHSSSSRSRHPDHGESHFVPLSSVDLANRGGSSSVRRPVVEEANADEALSTSEANGRLGIARRRRTHGNGGGGAASLSTSEIQSNEQLSAPSSSSNVRSMKDAKAALLRHAQGVSASVRVSRAQSFHRVSSNAGANTGGGNNNNNADLSTHRSAGWRGTSRERRSLNGSRSGVERDDGGNSLYSFGVDDDAVRMSISPGSMGSPMLGRPGVLFPGTAVSQELNTTSTSHAGTSRRFSRTEEGSAAILEVMETSALISHGNVAGDSISNAADSTGQHTRGRSTESVAKSKTGRRGNNSISREDTSYGLLPNAHSNSSYHGKHRHVFSNGFSLSHTGGNDDSTDSEDSEEEERHRHKVEEVMRQLNRPQRSTAGNRLSMMSRAAASGSMSMGNQVVAVLSTSTGHTTDGGGTSGTSVDRNNNGAGVSWSGIGSTGCGGFASFGAAAGDSMTNDNAGGGWTGLGGNSSTEDWYAHMRKKAAEEEEAEAAVATAALHSTANESPAEMNAKMTSPGTMSITASPGLAPGNQLPSGTAATSPTINEAPVPEVTRTSGTRRTSTFASVRCLGSSLTPTPDAKATASASTSANTSVHASSPTTRPLVSSRTPIKPSKSSTTAPEGGVTYVSSLIGRFDRRPSGVASRADQQPRQITTSAEFSEVPLDLSIEDIEVVGQDSTTAPSQPRSDSVVSATIPGRRPTLPEVSTAPSSNRRASRSSGVFFTPVALSAVNVGGSGSAPTSAGDATRVVLPVLPTARAEAWTPLSSTNRGVATPGHRRFDYRRRDSRRRDSLPCVLPVPTGNATSATRAVGGTNATSSASSSGTPVHAVPHNERHSIPSSSSGEIPGRGSAHPPPPATSASQNIRRSSTQPSATTDPLITIGVSNCAGTDTSLGTRRHSSPNKRTLVPATAGVRAGSTGLPPPGQPTGAAPKQPETGATTSRIIATSTRLPIS